MLPAADAKAMDVHPAEIAKQAAPGAHAVLALDGARCHAQTALNVPADIALPRLPPCAPELDPAENVRACLRANGLANTVFADFDDILDKACAAWMFFATDIARVMSATKREWAAVNVQGGWYDTSAPIWRARSKFTFQLSDPTSRPI